jgi:hypothetical protein
LSPRSYCLHIILNGQWHWAASVWANHSSLSSDNVQNAWSLTSTPIISHHGMVSLFIHRNNLKVNQTTIQIRCLQI